MVKKSKTHTKTDDKQLADAVRTSAQQIWQAGLGAFAKAQEEGGKVFARLVKEGTDLQKRTQKMAGEKVFDAGETVSKMADGVGKQAAGSWDKLEQVFEDRVARALSRIGVPNQKEIDALQARVEQLGNALAALTGQGAATAPAAPAKKSARSRAAAGAKSSAGTTAKAAPKPASKTRAKAAAKPAASKPKARAAGTRKTAGKAADDAAPALSVIARGNGGA